MLSHAVSSSSGAGMKDQGNVWRISGETGTGTLVVAGVGESAMPDELASDVRLLLPGPWNEENVGLPAGVDAWLEALDARRASLPLAGGIHMAPRAVACSDTRLSAWAKWKTSHCDGRPVTTQLPRQSGHEPIRHLRYPSEPPVTLLVVPVSWTEETPVMDDAYDGASARVHVPVVQHAGHSTCEHERK